VAAHLTAVRARIGVALIAAIVVALMRYDTARRQGRVVWLPGVLGALAKMPLDFVRGEKAGRNARDGYAAEHMEIASYELLSRIAQKAGDEETAAAAREIIEEERAMARVIELNWDRFAELSLQEEGITV